MWNNKANIWLGTKHEKYSIADKLSLNFSKSKPVRELVNEILK